MKYVYLILTLLFVTSCIPLRIAPTIKDYKLTTGKKFKRQLPKDNAFVFEDPKEANEFYNFINTKYSLNHQTVEYNVPINVDGVEFFLSFYETEISDKSINLIPFFANVALENKGVSPVFNDPQVKRQGNWYLALFVYDADMNDCLNSNYPDRIAILNHLKAIKKEYLNTNNYLEAMMKMN
mgnify:CR=1 FL=1